MEQVSENERFVVKNGIKRVYICVTSIIYILSQLFLIRMLFSKPIIIVIIIITIII
jgi:hypothetical protein